MAAASVALRPSNSLTPCLKLFINKKTVREGCGRARGIGQGDEMVSVGAGGEVREKNELRSEKWRGARYICVCVCVYACMYVGMHACMYACMYVCMHACVYACMFFRSTDIGIYMYTCMHAYMHVCVYIIALSYRYICKEREIATCRDSGSYLYMYACMHA